MLSQPPAVLIVSFTIVEDVYTLLLNVTLPQPLRVFEFVTGVITILIFTVL